MASLRMSNVSQSFIARRQRWGFYFVLPSVLFFVIFFLYPILSGFYYSLTDFTLLRPPQWVGLQNYQDLLKDRLFIKSIGVTLQFVLGSTVPVWIISLLAAVVFFQKFRGREVLKLLFFTPVLPSLVVVAVVWRILLHPSGVLTTLLRPFTGLGEINWLNDPVLSPISMILINDWSIIPFYMLIWLAGLTGIPEELRDAARVDGANPLQSFLRIELPLLRPTAVFVATISTINAFQAFTLQYTISPGRGGPIDVNTTMGLLIWKYGFQYYRMGDAAAVSVILFAIIMLVTGFQLLFSRGEQYSLN
ncbi:MAG: sugar ABC transporter permease [Chloroflexota bacterium]|nr:MAG: ABC transporter permease [Chloroflexota bacterium]